VTCDTDERRPAVNADLAEQRQQGRARRLLGLTLYRINRVVLGDPERRLEREVPRLHQRLTTAGIVLLAPDLFLFACESHSQTVRQQYSNV
jgi:hypothetical protein